MFMEFKATYLYIKQRDFVSVINGVKIVISDG